MAKHTTFKSSHDGKLQTLQRKAARQAKRAGLNTGSFTAIRKGA